MQQLSEALQAVTGAVLFEIIGCLYAWFHLMQQWIQFWPPTEQSIFYQFIVAKEIFRNIRKLDTP